MSLSLKMLFCVLLVAGFAVMIAPDRATAAGCSRATLGKIEAAATVARRALDQCGAAADGLTAGRGSIKAVCRVCKAALGKQRAVNRSFKAFSDTCANLVSGTDAQILTRLTRDLYASAVPLSQALKTHCP